MATGVHMIDVVSSPRLSCSPDKQILHQLHFGECVESHKKVEALFREWTPNGDLSPDLQSVDLSVRSCQISSPGGILVLRTRYKPTIFIFQCKIFLTEQEIHEYLLSI